MFFSAFKDYFQSSSLHVTWIHIAVIVVLSSTWSFLFRKKHSAYSTIVLGVTFFFCLLLLDMAVWNRFSGNISYKIKFDLNAEFYRLFHGTKVQRVQIILNFLAFLPLGFFLSEFFSSTRRFSVGRRLGYVSLSAFGLSLCIECLQFVFRLGLFEITDLFMNTLGAFVGTCIALLGRMLFKRKRGSF